PTWSSTPRSPKTAASGSISGPAESRALSWRESTRVCWSSWATETSRRAPWSTPTLGRHSRTHAARPGSTERWAARSEPPSGGRQARRHASVPGQLPAARRLTRLAGLGRARGARAAVAGVRVANRVRAERDGHRGHASHHELHRVCRRHVIAPFAYLDGASIG